MKIRTEQQKDNIRTWVKALRSGIYPQTTEVLEDEDGFCCLGVACVIGLAKPDRSETTPSFPTRESMEESFGLPANPQIPKMSTSLVYMNDHCYTFDEIADAIEETFLDD